MIFAEMFYDFLEIDLASAARGSDTWFVNLTDV
jgi:hypothetical protein